MITTILTIFVSIFFTLIITNTLNKKILELQDTIKYNKEYFALIKFKDEQVCRFIGPLKPEEFYYYITDNNKIIEKVFGPMNWSEQERYKDFLYKNEEIIEK